MKNAVVTGASGFVGSNLIPYLKEVSDVSVVAVSRNPEAKKLQSVSDKIISYENLFHSDEITHAHYIHLAGKAHDLKNTIDDSEYYEVNFELTKKLYNHFLNDELARSFIFISSVKAVADSVESELNEDFEPVPLSVYGKSKLKAEQYILDNMPKGREVIILRPCMVHGPANKGNLNLLYRFISNGIPWPFGKYENKRSFLSIENLCYVIHQILNGKVKSGIYNVADDEAFSTSALVALIAEINNKPVKIWKVPKSFLNAGAKLGNYIPLPLNEDRFQKLTEDYIVSNKKIKGELQITQMPVSAEEGIIRTLQSFQSS